MLGTFTKNLLLKDKKGGLFFVTAHEDSDIDLRTLHTRIDARGRLGFASGVMFERLRVTPGPATPMSLFHDTDGGSRSSSISDWRAAIDSNSTR